MSLSVLDTDLVEILTSFYIYGNIMVFVCHVIKGSCDYMGRNPSCQFWWP